MGQINGLDLGSEPTSPNSFVDAGLSAQLGPYLHSWKPQTRRTVTRRHVLVGAGQVGIASSGRGCELWENETVCPV